MVNMKIVNDFARLIGVLSSNQVLLKKDLESLEEFPSGNEELRYED